MPAKNKDTWKEVLKFHERAAAREDNRPCLTWSRYDADLGALATADRFRLHVTWGDFADHADAAGWVEHKRSILGEHYADTSELHFPNWVDLIPSDQPYQMTFTVGQMRQAVKTALVFARDTRNSVRFVCCPADGMIGVRGASAEFGAALSHVAITSEHGTRSLMPLVFALDGTYMLDALSALDDTATTTIYASASEAPVVVGDKNVQFALIMPMGIQDYRTATPDELARMTAEAVAEINHDTPTDYNPPRTWAQLHPVKRETKSKAVRDAERDHAEAVAAASAYTELEFGARMNAEVFHDPQGQPIESLLAGLHYRILCSADPALVLQVLPDAMRLILRHDAPREDSRYTAVLTFRREGAITRYTYQQVYDSDRRTVEQFSGTWSFVLNPRNFARRLSLRLESLNQRWHENADTEPLHLLIIRGKLPRRAPQAVPAVAAAA